jgi:hypothetical protein
VGTLAGIRDDHNRQEIAAFDIGAKLAFRDKIFSIHPIFDKKKDGSTGIS